MKEGCNILVATPGRLIDFLDSEEINLSHISICVLDEADTMLDMGFKDQIEKILNICNKNK